MYIGNENQNLVKEEGLLRLPEVLKRFPVSRSTWWAGVKSGKFPKSVKIGPRTVNACLEVHHSLRAKVHQFKTYF